MAVCERDARLCERVATEFTTDEIRPPNGYLFLLQEAARIIGQMPEHVEHLWRRAAGSAHGKRWPALVLQNIEVLDEYEPDQFRTIRTADPEAISVVLELGDLMLKYGVLRFAEFSGADVGALANESMEWLKGVVPTIKDP